MNTDLQRFLGRTRPRILGYRRNGRPIFSVAGAEDDPAPDDKPDPAPEDKPDPKGSDKPAPKEGDDSTGDAEPNADAEKWKKLARKHEANAKANAAAAAQLKELQDKDKSEGERLTEDRDGHKARADKAEAALWRAEIALEKGLTAGQAKRLHGDTRDALDEDAEELLADLGPRDDAAEAKPKPAGRPREQYRGGTADPTEAPEETDPAKLAALVPRRR